MNAVRALIPATGGPIPVSLNRAHFNTLALNFLISNAYFDGKIFRMKIKHILLPVVMLLLAGSAQSQTQKWSSLEYSHWSGPVSPEYQYNYRIIISYDGSANVTYKDANGEVFREFKIPSNKKGMKKLKKALKNSKVFDVPAESMKSDQTLIGGAESKLVITLRQDPLLDQPPGRIEIPSQVKDEYKDGIEKLYVTIKSLVPEEIRSETKIN